MSVSKDITKNKYMRSDLKNSKSRNFYPISACLVVYNEEKIIKTCLDSIKDIVNEIILVHDGECADNTLKMAKNYGAKIFIREHIGEAEPHRPFSFEQAKNDWILRLDADEALSKEFCEALPAMISSDEYCGYEFKWNIAPVGEPEKYDYKLALFRKSTMNKYYGIPHELVRLKGKIKREENIELLHNFQPVSPEKQKNKELVWPKVQGEYMEKFRFRKVPLIILSTGYVLYPLANIMSRLFSEYSKSWKDFKTIWIYSFRLWHSLVIHRIKRNRQK